MTYRLFIFLCLALCLGSPSSLSAGDVLDRIVATVNGHIILQSDWEDALLYQACADGRPAGDLTAAERKAALDHLIDQELLREQMRASDFQHAGDQQVAQRLGEIRKQYPSAQTEAGWQALLSSYGLTEESLRQYVTLELDLLRLVDARLRPSVKIEPQSIESYYNQEFLPQLRQSGENGIPLAQVEPKIKELLTQKKVNELLVAWLQDLRSVSEIHREPLDSQGELR